MQIKMSEQDLDAAVKEYFERRGLTLTRAPVYLDRDEDQTTVYADVEVEHAPAPPPGLVGSNFVRCE